MLARVAIFLLALSRANATCKTAAAAEAEAITYQDNLSAGCKAKLNGDGGTAPNCNSDFVACTLTVTPKMTVSCTGDQATCDAAMVGYQASKTEAEKPQVSSECMAAACDNSADLNEYGKAVAIMGDAALCNQMAQAQVAVEGITLTIDADAKLDVQCPTASASANTANAGGNDSSGTERATTMAALVLGFLAVFRL